MFFNSILRFCRQYLIAVLALLLVSSLAGQQLPIKFNRLDISHGLSNNQVRSILKDSKGFLWFATMSGLNRYDGYQFKVFRHSLQDSTSVSDDNMSRIFEGPENKLWIDTHSGYNIFDPLTEKVDRNMGSCLKRMGLPNIAITNMLKDKNGDYWFLMGKQSLFKYNHLTAKTLKLYDRPLTAAPVSYFTADNQGTIWMVHENAAVEQLNSQTGRVITSINAMTDFFKNEALNYSIFIDKQDELWIFAPTDARGILHYSPLSGALEHIDKESRPYHLNNNIVVSVLQDDNDDLWISTDHGGINLLNKKTHTISYILNNINDRKTLSENSITMAYRDNAGIIWVGTYKQGVSY